MELLGRYAQSHEVLGNIRTWKGKLNVNKGKIKVNVYGPLIAHQDCKWTNSLIPDQNP